MYWGPNKQHIDGYKFCNFSVVGLGCLRVFMLSGLDAGTTHHFVILAKMCRVHPSSIIMFNNQSRFRLERHQGYVKSAGVSG